MEAAYLSSFSPVLGEAFLHLVRKGPGQYLKNRAVPCFYENKYIKGKRMVVMAGGRGKKTKQKIQNPIMTQTNQKTH